MPEKIKNNIVLVIVIAGFLVTIFTGGMGYGQLLNKNDTLDQNVKAHCVNQTQSEKDLAGALLQFAEVTSALKTEVKNLKESITELKQEVRMLK